MAEVPRWRRPARPGGIGYSVVPRRRRRMSTMQNTAPAAAQTMRIKSMVCLLLSLIELIG